MAKPKRLPLFLWLLILAIPALWCALELTDQLRFLEDKLTDLRFRARGEITAPVKIIYVNVDAEAITELGRDPWDRTHFATVGRAILGGGAKAIGLDFVFSEKGMPEIVDRARFSAGNHALFSFLNEFPDRVVVAAAYASQYDRDINGQPFVRAFPRIEKLNISPAQPPELPEFRDDGKVVQNAPLIGLIDTLDGETRVVPAFAQAEVTYWHLSLHLARLHWGLSRDALKVSDDHLTFVRPDGSTQATIPLRNQQDIEVNWFTRWHSPLNVHNSFFTVLETAQLLTSEDAEIRAAATEAFRAFKDAIVIIGPVDPLLQDIAPTSLDEASVPRVGIHGNLLKTIITGQHLRRLPASAIVATVIFLTLLLTILALQAGPRRQLWRLLALALWIAYAIVAFVLFAKYHLVLPLTAPLGAAFTTSFAAIVVQLIREEKQKSRIKGMFGAYLSPELVDRMIESGDDPQLGGQEAEITAYFSDIQDFTSLAEQLTPAQLVELMNDYLTACTDILTQQGGTLDKYVGDAVIAMFGAPVAMPDHAYRACVTSQLIQLRLDDLRAKWVADNNRWPAQVAQLTTRIGLNTGPAVVGNMGSSTRFNYTMTGDSVNLASRLETGARSYGVHTLVSESTRAAAEEHGDGQCVFRFLDRIIVKGRRQPVGIHELMGLRDILPPESRECARVFTEALGKYFRQDFEAAAALFAESAKLESGRDQGETPSHVYLTRCAALIKDPPPIDWNGVFVMKGK